jgi:hypothetical protein
VFNNQSIFDNQSINDALREPLTVFRQDAPYLSLRLKKQFAYQAIIHSSVSNATQAKFE